ncbi:GMC family oxidoreductase N-terminal domain-containing protein [Ruegeria sp.]|uniref:GMC family oxidoreductase n=1 Tax=Ruegeria sp. TaxID=1879320 RepID=UPI002325ABCE|nr:GMC family oxidoreductase N-terminal domain-containing protein [Ruegeria sp.]MDA7966437.1 GMC family oxidoreductase N-terminal domain-containing protein [Ruegeria sp.]
MSVYDYVIAGGGSAGCALAARLAEDPDVSVCVVEAGGKGRDLFIRMPAGNGFVFGNPRLDWGYHSVPQPGLNGRRIYYPRGKALGGSSIVNGMIYMRGVAADYDMWRQAGLPGWSYAEVLPYFRRSEGARDRLDAWHGQDGPLKTEPARNFGEMERAFIAAAKAAGHREIADFNGPERTGVARNDSTVSKGVRQSSAIAYLANPPPNLTLRTDCQIARIVLDGTRATGVETLDGQTIRARREVIVCQGSFGTPHLLMLSGIGPADHLTQHGIQVLADLPSVGANLSDHPDVPMQYGSDRMDLSHARYQRLDHAARLMGKWLLNGSGPGGGAFFSTILFHALDDPALPELEVFMTPMVVEENLGNGAGEQVPLLQRLGRKLLVRGRKMARPGVQLDINLERPRSTGTVRLASADPRAHPLIDPNYFADPQDIDHLRRGVHAMREIMAQDPIAKLVTGEIGPWKDAHSDDEITQAIRETAYTGHHPACTARMGDVLDAELRVHGVQGLRVCDASAMPMQITGNLYATVVMMAEKAADMILGRPPLPPEYPTEPS